MVASCSVVCESLVSSWWFRVGAASVAVSESRMFSEAASESSLPQYGLHKSD